MRLFCKCRSLLHVCQVGGQSLTFAVFGSWCAPQGPFIRLWGDRPQAAPDYMFVIFPAHKQVQEQTWQPSAQH